MAVAMLRGGPYRRCIENRIRPGNTDLGSLPTMTHPELARTLPGRASVPRALGLLAALAVTGLIGAGCSNAPAGSAAGNAAGGNAPSGTAANTERAVRFAQCMRSNGVANFPDPSASGQFTIDAIANGSGIDVASAGFQQALNACKGLEPAGFTGSPRSAQQQQAALGFAQCIRANGVSDFPDPTPDGPLVDTNRIPSAATPTGMSALHAAMQRCGSFARAAGVTGGR